MVVGNKEKARVMYNSIAEAFILMFFEVKTKKERENGQGKCIIFDGNVYKGAWKDGEVNGQGIYIYSDGMEGQQ